MKWDNHDKCFKYEMECVCGHMGMTRIVQEFNPTPDTRIAWSSVARCTKCEKEISRITTWITPAQAKALQP